MNAVPVAAAVVFFLLGAASAGADPLLERLLIIAPAAPGGGWDQTARAMQHALETEGIVRRVEVQNVAGAAGTIGLAQFVSTQRSNGAALLVTGLVMVGATIWNDSPVSLGQVTPVARLTGEYEVVAVPAASPHRDMRGLAAALRAHPGAVSWGGGSAGGTDHILAGLIAAAVGADPRAVNYIAFSGGGEAVAALLGGNVTAGVSGYSEFAPHIHSGRLRALAISAADRVRGIDVPTLREQGLDVDLANWRAVVAPPGLSREERRRLGDVVARMSRSAAWRKTLADRDWIDTYQDGDAFARYLESERVRIARIVIRLRGPGGGEPIRAGQRLFPTAILLGALVIAILLVRNRSVDRETHVANRRALLWVVCGLAAFLLLLEPAGFIVAASVLFVLVGRGFAPCAAGAPVRADAGDRMWGRGSAGLLVGLMFSTLVYLAFTRGLDLALPAGRSWTWMR